jgi:hypothetical protein
MADASDLARARLELAAFLGDPTAGAATGVRPGRQKGLRPWLDAAPGATAPAAPPPPDPRAARLEYLRRLNEEVRGLDPALDDQLDVALAEPTTLALSNVAQRVSSKAVSSRFPRAVDAMNELIALTTGTMEVARAPSPPLSEVHARAGIAAVRALLGPPTPELRARIAHGLGALRESPRRMLGWARDLDEDLDAELRLSSVELQVLGRASLLIEALREGKDRSDAGPRGLRAAAALHQALEGGDSTELDEVLRLATRALGAGPTKEAIVAELLPWALGADDPVAARVGPLLAALGEDASG